MTAEDAITVADTEEQEAVEAEKRALKEQDEAHSALQKLKEERADVDQVKQQLETSVCAAREAESSVQHLHDRLKALKDVWTLNVKTLVY